MDLKQLNPRGEHFGQAYCIESRNFIFEATRNFGTRKQNLMIVKIKFIFRSINKFGGCQVFSSSSRTSMSCRLSRTVPTDTINDNVCKLYRSSAISVTIFTIILHIHISATFRSCTQFVNFLCQFHSVAKLAF